MTKADLIEEVSRVVEMTRKESEVIVEAIFDSIVRSLRTGDKIEIRGFGSFRTRQRQPRIGRNPKTGARVEVPAKKIPYFKPSKELKDVVNNSAAPRRRAAPPPEPPEAGPEPVTDMDYLWTPWRYQYLTDAGKPDECVFCAAAQRYRRSRAPGGPPRRAQFRHPEPLSRTPAATSWSCRTQHVATLQDLPRRDARPR